MMLDILQDIYDMDVQEIVNKHAERATDGCPYGGKLQPIRPVCALGTSPCTEEALRRAGRKTCGAVALVAACTFGAVLMLTTIQFGMGDIVGGLLGCAALLLLGATVWLFGKEALK